MCSREDVLLKMEGGLNGLLVKSSPPSLQVTCKSLEASWRCAHTHQMFMSTHTQGRAEGHTWRKTCGAIDVCMHAYIQCMHANGWQSIFFLTPATSCNTSLSGSLSPPIRICALVIRRGLRQKVEQPWHQFPSGSWKRWSCTGRCHGGRLHSARPTAS